MGRLSALLTAVLFAVNSMHVVKASSIESLNNDDSPWFPSSSRYDVLNYDTSYDTPYGMPYDSLYHSYWDSGASDNYMDIDGMVSKILDEVNAGQSSALDPDFSKNLQDSIQDNIAKSLENVNNVQNQIVMETKKIQEKNNAAQSKMINGDDGVTLLEIEGNSQPKKQYVIKDGKWSTCKDTLCTTEIPSCASGLVDSSPDVCAFNAIVKYNVILEPNSVFKDSNLVCLIKGNANSVRQFSGVPEKTVNDTCTKGDVLTLKDFNEKCGEEEKISYYYWPNDKKNCDGNNVCSTSINWTVSSKGISQSTTSGPGGSDDNNNFSVVSSSVSNINKKK